MSTILMLCHDQHLDRRVVAQALSLVKVGHRVTLLALAFEAESSEEDIADGVHLVRIGLRHIVPENPTYVGYLKRQHWLNDRLNQLANRFPRLRAVLLRAFSQLSRANGAWYRGALYLRYRNLAMPDPLPFRSAFVAHGLQQQYDLVQVHDLPALEAGVELAQRAGVKLVYDAHELYPEQRSFSTPQRRLCSEQEQRFVRHADLVFTVNASISEEMARRYGIQAPQVILNALDPVPEFDPSGHYDLLRAKLGLPATQRIVLFQGGFSPNRNLEFLVDAFSHVQQPDLVLVMMGFGDYGELLKARAAAAGTLGRRVHFLPAVPQQELLQHTASADLGVIPYPHVDLNSYYCTPNKLFEFIQAGLPIVANDSPELNRFVRDNGFGINCRMSRPQEIASALDHAIASGALQAWRQALVARRHEFSWQVEEQKFLQAYSQVLPASITDVPAG